MIKTSNNPNSQPKIHPIKLVHLGTKELSIRARSAPQIDIGLNVEQCSIVVGNSEYDKERKRIAVSIKLQAGDKNDSDPYEIKIELIGIFQIDELTFPLNHLPDWAKQNAPMILYPYLREHTFALSVRAGFKPLLLPLLEVPTFKLEQKPKRKKTQPK